MVHMRTQSHLGSGEHMGGGRLGFRVKILKKTKLTPKGGAGIIEGRGRSPKDLQREPKEGEAVPLGLVQQPQHFL